ncbi:MAG: hypothetical protein HY791_38555 [Deltaproteobacteria bacterium]|nr:hypothetical protein [Deltaproteobacteria bacterium]
MRAKVTLGFLLSALVGTLGAQASPTLGVIVAAALGGALLPFLSGETWVRTLMACAFSVAAALVFRLYLAEVLGSGHAEVRTFAEGPWMAVAIVPLIGFFSFIDLRASGRDIGRERVTAWRR